MNPSDNEALSLFTSASEWVDGRVLDSLRQSITGQLASLTQAEQLRYRQLVRQHLAALKNLENEDSAIKEAFKTQGTGLIRARLLALTGKDLDPHQVFIHTRFLALPQRSSALATRLKRSVAAPQDGGEAEVLPEPQAIRDEHAPLVHVLSMSLWQAACVNFGFLSYFASFRSGSLINASYINASAGTDLRQPQIPESIDSTSIISVRTFVDVARELNLGVKLREQLEASMAEGAVLQTLLRTYTKAHLQFCLLDLYRRSARPPSVRANIRALSEVLDHPLGRLRVTPIVLTKKFKASEYWLGHGFRVQTGLILSNRPAPEFEWEEHHIHIPLYQIEYVGGQGLFSFFPGRPDGELRLHDSQSHLIADFRAQLLKARADNTLGWFEAHLTAPFYEKLTAVIPDVIDATNFNFIGRLPHLKRGWIPFDELGFKPMSVRTSLEDTLHTFTCEQYLYRLKQMAVEKSVKDWEDVRTVASVFLDEVSSLLLIPVPGATKGLSRAIQFLFLGATARSAFSALQQASHSDSAGLAQTLVDALDILITPWLNSKAGRLAHRRQLKLLHSMGQPRPYVRSDGTTDVWMSDPARFAPVPQDVTQNMALDERGIYRHEARDYVFLEKDGRQSVVEVVRNPDGTWRAITSVNAASYRPQVEWDATQQRWSLKNYDLSNLSDAQFLSMLTPGLTEQPAQVALGISAVTRSQLQGMWAGDAAPASLADAVTRALADTLLERCAQRLSHDVQSSSVIERPVLALMTQLDDWPKDKRLRVFDHDGHLNDTYGQSWREGSASNTLDIRRLDDGVLVLNRPSVLKAFDEDFFSAVIRELSLPTTKTQLVTLLSTQLQTHKAALFNALTLNADRLPASGVASSLDLNFLALESPRKAPPLPVMHRLRDLHAGLSQARCGELIRAYPELVRYMAHLDESRAPRVASEVYHLPDTLYNAIRQAIFTARVERMLDGIYHPRAFNPDADQWSRIVSAGLIKEWLGADLIIDVSGIDGGAAAYRYSNTAWVLTAHGQGKYSAYDTHTYAPIPAIEGPDSFFEALIAGYKASPVHDTRLSDFLLTAHGWRTFVCKRLMAQRSAQGFLDPKRPQVKSYALKDPRAVADVRPDAQGRYTLNNAPAIVIDGHCYQVQSPFNGVVASIIDATCFAKAPIRAYGNGAGAWRHQFERPLEWDGQYLFRRLGYGASHFDADQITAILHTSGTTEERLRRVHVNDEQPPPLLLDTQQRFKLVRSLEILLSKRASDAEGSFFNDIKNAFEGPEQQGVMAPLTVEQLQAFRPLLKPGDRFYDVLSQTPDDVVYAHVLYHHLTRSEGLVTPVLFDLIAELSERQPDPSVALIMRVFPSLPGCIATDLVQSASPFERSQMKEQGRVPLRLAQEARWYARELRINRAIEGFYLPGLQNNDSVKLMMHWLAKHPGWPASVKINVHEGSPGGNLISTLGPDSAAVQVTILKTQQGWHASRASDNAESVRGHDFFSVLLAALPTHERQALGYTDESAAVLLKEQLTLKAAENRDSAFQALGMVLPQPWFLPPRRLADGRIGYTLSGRGEASERWLGDLPLIRRYQNLYPASPPDEAQRAINRMRERRLNIGAEFTRLEAEFTVLEQQLKEWVSHTHDTQTGDAGTRNHKAGVAQALVRAWRKETPAFTNEAGAIVGYTLVLEGTRVATLPVPTAGFGHIRQLVLNDSRVGAGVGLGVNENINQFLRCFPRLSVLKMERCLLSGFPEAIGQLENLIELSLSYNAIRLDEANLNALTRLVRLQRLNLKGCRLSTRFDARNLTALRVLNLANTETETWPLGALQLAHLTRLDLTDNHIRVLPPAVLQGSEAINRITFLQGNRLEPAALRELHAYQRRTGISFGLHHIADHPSLLPFDRQVWLNGLDPRVRTVRQQECELLQADPQAEAFFELLGRLTTTADFTNAPHDLALRVQSLLHAAALDEGLRSALFELAAEPRQCCDSVAMLFSRLELQVHVSAALASDDPVQAELNLARLIRGEFRGHQLDRLAGEEVRKRGGAEAVDELEIALFYRLQLTDELQLPAQPKHMRFNTLGAVETHVIERARDAVLVLEGGELMIHYMTLNQFWVGFLETRYADRFEALNSVKAEIDFEAMGDIENERYTATVDNFESWKRERQVLLNGLTHSALARLT